MTRISVIANTGRMLKLYVLDCVTCGVVFAVDETYGNRRREDHRIFCCPNGHQQSYSGPSRAEKEAAAAKEAAERLRVRLRAEQDQAEAARREAAEAKAREVRLRWRVGNGVCPCCQRTFSALAAHVATKHPDFVHGDIATLSVRMRELLVTIRRALEETDEAVLEVATIDAHMGTVRALANRGLVDWIDYERVSLTEKGWPLSEQALAGEGVLR